MLAFVNIYYPFKTNLHHGQLASQQAASEIRILRPFLIKATGILIGSDRRGNKKVLFSFYLRNEHFITSKLYHSYQKSHQYLPLIKILLPITSIRHLLLCVAQIQRFCSVKTIRLSLLPMVPRMEEEDEVEEEDKKRLHDGELVKAIGC